MNLSHNFCSDLTKEIQKAQEYSSLNPAGIVNEQKIVSHGFSA